MNRQSLKKLKLLAVLLLCTPLVAAAQNCDESLWNHVYNPKRLQVIEKCKTVTGVIRDYSTERDGDLHIQIKLDPEFKNLINSANRKSQHGCIVVEPICQKKVVQNSAIGTCANYKKKKLRIPPRGTRVQITGSYVLDRQHGWTEIHPVTRIKKL